MKTKFTVLCLLLAPYAISIQARGDEAFASGNGDANGDHVVDLADAVYLLNGLFRGGPPPVPVAPCPTDPGLPATGQSKCYGVVDQKGWADVQPSAPTLPVHFGKTLPTIGFVDRARGVPGDNRSHNGLKDGRRSVEIPPNGELFAALKEAPVPSLMVKALDNSQSSAAACRVDSSVRCEKKPCLSHLLNNPQACPNAEEQRHSWSGTGFAFSLM